MGERRAAEKQKAGLVGLPDYKQATLTGFRVQVPSAYLKSGTRRSGQCPALQRVGPGPRKVSVTVFNGFILAPLQPDCLTL